MTSTTFEALAQKLDALVTIANEQGWCDGSVFFFATPNRESVRTGAYIDDARTLLAVRCGRKEANGSIVLAERKTGWEDDVPFLLLATAALAMDGHVYNPQVSHPSGPVSVENIPNLGTAHDRLACRARMEQHLTAMGWAPGVYIGSYAVIDQAVSAITKALADLRK